MGKLKFSKMIGKFLFLLAAFFVISSTVSAVVVQYPAKEIYSGNRCINGYCGNGYQGNGYCGNGYCGNSYCINGYCGQDNGNAVSFRTLNEINEEENTLHTKNLREAKTGEIQGGGIQENIMNYKAIAKNI